MSETKFTRRQVLAGLGTAVGAATLGCSTSPPGSVDPLVGEDAAGLDGGRADAEHPVDAGLPVDGSMDANVLDASPPDATPLTPKELLAGIDTIVVLCMENRSFDHYLGALKLVEGKAVDGLSGSEMNPDSDGDEVKVHALTDTSVESPPHSWEASRAQFNDGANDGFVIAHEGDSEEEVMGYYQREQLPIHYALADAHTVCDRWFASVMGPTWPNRFYLHAATSERTTSNVPVFSLDTIWDALDGKGITNQNYYSDLPWCSGGYFKFSGLSGIEKFFDDAEAGTLPAFSLIDPAFLPGGNDDHPSTADVTEGQALIASLYTALAKSPHWNKCLFVITYDEHGGFYDHVPPGKTVDEEPDFEQLGFRVPALVCGPFARKGVAVSTTLEHVSVIATLTTRFDLAPLNERVSATADLSCCIDPAFLSDPQPAVVLPPVEISRIRPPARGTAFDELAEAADAGRIPAHLDRRGRMEKIRAQVLRHGERLGVVKFKD